MDSVGFHFSTCYFWLPKERSNNDILIGFSGYFSIAHALESTGEHFRNVDSSALSSISWIRISECRDWVYMFIKCFAGDSDAQCKLRITCIEWSICEIMSPSLSFTKGKHSIGYEYYLYKYLLKYVKGSRWAEVGLRVHHLPALNTLHSFTPSNGFHSHFSFEESPRKL